jgi:hypothetical protein
MPDTRRIGRDADMNKESESKKRYLKELQNIKWDLQEVCLLNIHTAKHAQLWYELETYFFIPVDSEKNPTGNAVQTGIDSASFRYPAMA